jgi:hypothetical protein
MDERKHQGQSYLVSWGGERLSPLGTSATNWLIVPALDDGTRIGRGNRSIRRKPAPVPLCPPRIPHDLTWDRTLVTMVVSRRRTQLILCMTTTRLTNRLGKWEMHVGGDVCFSQSPHVLCMYFSILGAEEFLRTKVLIVSKILKYSAVKRGVPPFVFWVTYCLVSIIWRLRDKHCFFMIFEERKD